MREQNNCFSVVRRTCSKEFQEQKSNKRQHDPEETSPTVVEILGSKYWKWIQVYRRVHSKLEPEHLMICQHAHYLVAYFKCQGFKSVGQFTL